MASVNRREVSGVTPSAAVDGGPPASRRPRGRPAKTSLPEIVEAALAVARLEGLAAVSMRSVADRVGIHQMSMYSYVSNKDALLRAMLDTTFARGVVLPESADPRDPAAQLKEIFRQLQVLAAENVELLSLIGRTQATETQPLLALDRCLELLGRLGLCARDQGLVYNLLYHLTMTSGLLVGNRARAFEETAEPAPPIEPELRDPESFPHLGPVLAAGFGASPESVFEACLESIFAVYVPALAGAAA